MRIAIVLVILALAVAAALVFLVQNDDGRRELALALPEPPRTAEPGIEADPRLEGLERARPAPRMEGSAEDDPGSGPAPAADAEPAIVRGRVLDLAGRPLSGVGVAAARLPRDVLAHSGADGSFELTVTKLPFELVVSDARYTGPIVARVRRPLVADDQTLVAVPRIELAGRVTDELGNGLKEAELRVRNPRLVDFPLPLEGARAWHPATRTDADGSFAFKDVAAVPGATLHTTCAGFEDDARAFPTTGAQAISIELQAGSSSASDTEGQIHGRVEFADGSPAPDATVQYDELKTQTDAQGRFRLGPAAGAQSGSPLVAAKPGYQAAVLDDFAARVAAGELGPHRLVLGEAALSIAGKVVDGQGKPLQGWHVHLVDPLAIERGRIPFTTAESLARAGKDQDRTDGEGRFRFGGLAERSYRLRAWQDSTLLVVQSQPVPAGSDDVVLRLADDAIIPRLVGRVLAHDGVPIEAAEVAVNFVTARSGGASAWVEGQSAATDADGEFVLENAPRRFVKLSIHGPHIVNRSLDPGDEDLPEALEIRVWRRCHLRCEWTGAGEAPDAMGVYDVTGQTLPLSVQSAGSTSSFTRERLKEGRSRVVSVSEAATEVALFRDGEEVARLPLQFVPGEVTVVRP